MSDKVIGVKTNARYVVVFGICMVVFAIILGAGALLRTLESECPTQEREIKLMDEITQLKDQLMMQELMHAAMKRREWILTKLQEHHDLCYDIEIFNKPYPIEKKEDVATNCDDETMDKEQHEKNKMLPLQQITTDGPLSSNGKWRKKPSTHKHNINSKYNKSVNPTNVRKKDTTAKKSSTSEAIIYLFAMIFVYLLINSASDVYQHYKLQIKGDKRLRRCSLQSYAQTHKPERRTSKGIILRQSLSISTD